MSVSTILVANERRGAAKVITRYAQRMLIENALSDAAEPVNKNETAGS